MRVRRPSPQQIDALLRDSGLTFNYPEVGATADTESVRAMKSGYDVDCRRFPLGSGRELFERARSALLAWRHYDIRWLQLHGAPTPVHEGQMVATETRVAGIWFVNPCRVVYLLDNVAEAPNETAFAYGTLVGHVECGEERFTVRIDPATGEVEYEILAFSRPAVLLTKLAYRWVRRLQRQFTLCSAEALARACGPDQATIRRSMSHLRVDLPRC